MSNFLKNKTLLKEIKGGNEDAFKFLFKMYYPRLVGYARKFVVDEEIAKDLVQEVFIRFYEKINDLENTSISSLLFLMVRNSCLNYLKHLAIVEKYKKDFLNKYNTAEVLYQLDFMNNTDCKLLYDELETEIHKIISDLPDRCQQVFIMSRFECLKNREIAEKLNISTTAVEKHISKAIKYLKTHFDTSSAMLLLLLTISLL